MKLNLQKIPTIAGGLCLMLFATNLNAQLSATELDRLFAGDASQGDAFGWSVDVDGNRAVIGAPNDDADGIGGNTGAAYVFLKNVLNGEWEQEDKLLMPGLAAGDQFGTSVAISGNVLVIGAPQDDVNAGSFLHGSAFVFTNSAGNWDSGVELLTDTPDSSEIEHQAIYVQSADGQVATSVSKPSSKTRF